MQAVETAADPLQLVLGRLDERQPMPADVVAEQVQRRLDRDRVRLHPEQLDRRAELLVQLLGALDVAGLEARDELSYLRADDVRVHADAPEPAEPKERQDQVVVARVEVEPELDDPPDRKSTRLNSSH